MKRHPLNTDRPARYADLRSGELYHGDDDRVLFHPVLLIVAVGITVAAFGIALLVGVPAHEPVATPKPCYSGGANYTRQTRAAVRRDET